MYTLLSQKRRPALFPFVFLQIPWYNVCMCMYIYVHPVHTAYNIRLIFDIIRGRFENSNQTQKETR